MTRRYFKDPVIALYMMKHFDVRVNLFNSKRIPLSGNKLYRKPNVPDSEVYAEMVSYLQFCIDKNGKVYVAKESEHIFEPQKGDDGKPKSNLNAIPLRCCENNNILTWDTVDRIKRARQIYCEIDNQATLMRTN